MSTLDDFNKTVETEIEKITEATNQVASATKKADLARGAVAQTLTKVTTADSELLAAQQLVSKAVGEAEKAIDEAYFSLPVTDRPAQGQTRHSVKAEIDYTIQDMWK